MSDSGEPELKKKKHCPRVVKSKGHCWDQMGALKCIKIFTHCFSALSIVQEENVSPV